MKRFSTIFAGMATSVAGLAIALMPSAVGAAPPVGSSFSDAAVFTGNATITGGSGNCGVNVCWSGGSGTYTFSSSACTYVSESDGSPGGTPLNEHGNCSITDTAGSFTNQICGTGTASGTASVTATTGADVGETTTVNYTITFKGTVGTVDGTGTESDSGPVHATGVVQIGSTSLSPPTLPLASSPCTSKFSVTGAVILTDDPGGA